MFFLGKLDFLNSEKVIVFNEGEDIATYYDNGNILSIYKGASLNNEPFGQGVKYEYSIDGSLSEKSEGEWINGKINGDGCISYYMPEGYIFWEFKGDFQNGLLHGQGSNIHYHYIDNKHQILGKYEGTWFEGKEHGQGIETRYDSDGDIEQEYEGEFKDGQYHGQGKLIGEVRRDLNFEYEGEFKDGNYHGHGIFILYYEDFFEKNKIMKYEGAWFEGKYHGQGIITTYHYIDRKKVNYSGNFSNGLFDGNGVIDFYDSREDIKNKYEGGFKDGKYHGQGKLTAIYSDSEQEYEGGFKDGQYHGQGKLTATGDFIFFDRLEYEGGFNNGEYNSQGSLNLYDYEEVLFFFKGNKLLEAEYKGEFVESNIISGRYYCYVKGECWFKSNVIYKNGNQYQVEVEPVWEYFKSEEGKESFKTYEGEQLHDIDRAKEIVEEIAEYKPDFSSFLEDLRQYYH